MFCGIRLFRWGSQRVSFGAETGTVNVKLKSVNNNNDEKETSIHCQTKKKALTISDEELIG
ncbi:hypothetical protein B9L19_08820 [Geobacillus thermocatenulatus]|uniref:Uncharacterized protein n=1 Tax=Geobacillus thermocatenulatus TaxID=33938 RepID=A0AA91QJI0_9BACL|nr:hypothetical protein B9L19_08820 [Geobacillus thermocatenulatus]